MSCLSKKESLNGRSRKNTRLAYLLRQQEEQRQQRRDAYLNDPTFPPLLVAQRLIERFRYPEDVAEDLKKHFLRYDDLFVMGVNKALSEIGKSDYSPKETVVRLLDIVLNHVSLAKEFHKDYKSRGEPVSTFFVKSWTPFLWLRVHDQVPNAQIRTGRTYSDNIFFEKCGELSDLFKLVFDKLSYRALEIIKRAETVGAKSNLHTFIVCQTVDNASIIVDPTIGQYIENYGQIFVGDPEELIQLLEKAVEEGTLLHMEGYQAESASHLSDPQWDFLSSRDDLIKNGYVPPGAKPQEIAQSLWFSASPSFASFMPKQI